MKISIITATFNSEKNISHCIKSIEDQTYHDIEHIIIDGDSTDKTVQIVKKNASVSKWISEPDKGIYDALNKGIYLATGNIIGFLHSDDMYASASVINIIADAFADQSDLNNNKPDIVYGNLVFTDQHNTNKVIRNWKSQPFKPSLLQRGWMPPHPTIFMRREVYERHGKFNIGLKCSADYDFILRVFRDQSLTISYLPQTLVKMRVGGISTSGFANLINKKKEDYWVLKNNKMSFPLLILFAKNILKIPQLIFKKNKI